MLNKGIRKYISNPAIGLLPFVLYVILHCVQIQEQCAIIASLLFAIIGELTVRKIYGNRIASITFFISIIALFFTLLLWIFTHDIIKRANIYIIICEITITCLFIAFYLFKSYIELKFFNEANLLEKTLLDEFYLCAKFLQYTLTIHIFSVVFYRQFRPDITPFDFWDIMVFAVPPVLLILIMGTYQALKTKTIATKLKQEEWLPIVTEKGAVTGKIAKTVSLNMQNKFLHPVVRVALISKGKVYLQERNSKDTLSPNKLDYPFEKYMLFNHDVNVAAKNSVVQMMGENKIDSEMKFVLKYVFENEETKRLVFLFFINIADENSIKKTSTMTGKFWTVKQIEEGFIDEIFSECFELEFEYLKNMVLTPTELMG